MKHGGHSMVALVRTVAYLGLEAREVEVQCHIGPGLPRFNLVGLPDKAVSESRERVYAALAAIGLALPPKRITVNLSPAIGSRWASLRSMAASSPAPAC
jgi:magnesium chelatase family protein